MNSFQLEQLIGCYIDDELPPERMAEVERLLRYNTMAKKMYDELTSIRKELQHIPRRNVKYDFQERLFARIDATLTGSTIEPAKKRLSYNEEETVSEQLQPLKRNPVNWIVSALAIAACVFCCITIWQTGHQTKPSNIAVNPPQVNTNEEKQETPTIEPYFSPPPLSASSNVPDLQNHSQMVIITDKSTQLAVVNVSCRLTEDAYEKQYVPKLLADAGFSYKIRQHDDDKVTVYEFQATPQDFMPILSRLYQDRDNVLNYQISDVFLSLLQRPEGSHENIVGPTALVQIYFNVQANE
ncbi:MAG: hypothetical protein LBJ67_08120 [Planctomycetaceae bacterium]|jgi:hypothetical protein|nr:hypothetical protein [Planctomycetaceae bacterium]